ncbi:MAG: GNAT family N-acetyltransferase [Bacteroidia bacterium]
MQEQVPAAHALGNEKSDQIVAWELDDKETEARDAELMALFYQVVHDDLFCLSLPPTGYVSDLKKALGDAFTVTGYFLKDRLIGFRASLHYEGTTHAYMVGFSREHNREYKLYQRMLYDYVHEGIEVGSRLLDMGRTALEIKSCLGATPVQYFLHIRFRYPCVHALIKPVFNRLSPAAWEPRNPFSTT